MVDAETGGDEEVLPKLHRFTIDLTNWLTIVSIVLLVVYGVLIIIYEIVLDLTNVRTAFLGFLICCGVDVISYWICRYAVRDAGEGEKCLLILAMVTQIITGLYYLIVPIIVLCTFRFIPEVSLNSKDVVIDDISTAEKEPQYEEQFHHTFEEYVNPGPCADGVGDKNTDPMWECGYVKSIQVASWWMMVQVIPKCLICYLIFRIMKKKNT